MTCAEKTIITKLKTCFTCNVKGHISRFCPKRNTANSSAAEYRSTNNSRDSGLTPANRIKLVLGLDEVKLEFLYDPGSQYSMLTRATYDKLVRKPPIMPTSLVGMGVQKVPFKLDGFVRMNCQFFDDNGEVFVLTDEPFLISDAIDTNIFGMHSEERFKVISRDNSKGVLSFTTINGSQVNMRFFCEKKSDVNCGHVFVHKATVLQPQSLSLVKSKLKNKKIDNESLMVLNGIEDFSIKTSDLLLSNVTSRSLYVPVRNDSNDEVTLKKGHYLGHTSDVEMDNSMDTNIAAISSLCVEDKAMNEGRKLGNSW